MKKSLFRFLCLVSIAFFIMSYSGTLQAIAIEKQYDYLRVDCHGDINGDGEFNISDVVLFQKWLLAVPETHLVNWKAADLYEDGRLDVFDLVLMKRDLIEIEKDEQFNYLAIGNSITIHRKCSYWWNEVGMAASDKNHDYFHIVLNYLKSRNNNVNGMCYNFSVWEVQSWDRDEMLPLLDSFLNTDLDLVTIQLGENASDLTTFESDYISLINYVKKSAPHAKILVIGDFWNKSNRNDLKCAAADSTEAEFVSLEGIADNEEYYCGLGTIVYDEDGKEHIVDHEGVASHPGDLGMLFIAERIIEVLKNHNS